VPGVWSVIVPIVIRPSFLHTIVFTDVPFVLLPNENRWGVYFGSAIFWTSRVALTWIGMVNRIPPDDCPIARRPNPEGIVVFQEKGVVTDEGLIGIRKDAASDSFVLRP
jgi:hypothetical protein